MPKQVIVIMQDDYPFGQCEQCTNENIRVLVRKIYAVSLQQRNKLLEKAGILRNLRNEHMISIQSVLEEEQSVHFLFEYIPIKLQTWISNINDEFIEKFRNQLIRFSAFLANNFIKIDFQLKNIGMDQNYGAKYFLNLDFQVDYTLNREKLKTQYIQDINNLFKPYIMIDINHKLQNELKNEYRNVQVPSSPTYASQPVSPEIVRKNNVPTSPPTNKITSKHKEKALEKYYQEVNMSVDSQNEKILQEFMDVLDNEGEEQTRKWKEPERQSKQEKAKKDEEKIKKEEKAKKDAEKAKKEEERQKNEEQKAKKEQIRLKREEEIGKLQLTSSKKDIEGQKSSPKQSPRDRKNDGEILPTNSPKYQKNNQFEDQRKQASATSQVNEPAIFNSPQSNKSHKAVSAAPKLTNPRYNMPRNLNNEEVVWRQTNDLQERVKNAIMKSMEIIKKFKNIKDSSIL